jgi:RHS repeat-associated protein
MNAFQYTGRESDAETGLYYSRARYYDPNTGRFLSEDLCPELLEKIEINAHIVASHSLFDAANGTDHSTDIGDYSRALARCIKFFNEKCKPGTPCPQSQPSEQSKIVPAPVPSDPATKAATAVSVGVIIYYIVSEGSRVLFPPRNLIPIP